MEKIKLDLLNLMEKLPKIKAKAGFKIRVKEVIAAEEFEKDNDKNYHIDFIYAMANCRS